MCWAGPWDYHAGCDHLDACWRFGLKVVELKLSTHRCWFGSLDAGCWLKVWAGRVREPFRPAQSARLSAKMGKEAGSERAR